MPRLLAAVPAVAGLQQIVDRIGGGVDVYSALGVLPSSSSIRKIKSSTFAGFAAA